MAVKSTITFLLATAVICFTSEAHAAAFGVHNQTSQKFRIRVHDRGQFRDWVEMPPGFKDITARSVERKDHAVEIDIWTTVEGRPQPDWISFYRGAHGSRVFTRKLHLFEYRDGRGNSTIYLTWYDEPPGCRDWPVFEKSRIQSGCLLRSGWSDDIFQRVAEAVGRTAFRAIFGGG